LNSIKITSRDNALLRRARAVRDGKIKDLVFAEGLRLCEEALQSGLNIESVIYSDQIAEKERAASFLATARPVVRQVAEVSEKLLETISYTKTPQGIISLVSRPESRPPKVDENRPALIVVMHNLNNPVNVGAILRTSEAAGVSGAIATAHTSDPFSPKALRGAMGAAFRVPVWTGPAYEDVLAWCRDDGLITICADAHQQRIYTDVDWHRPCALVFGPESIGLSAAELKAADETVSIPMEGSVESLNVAVASGILLYEAARQRRVAKS